MQDVARARKFYEETIGLDPKHETESGVVYEFARGTVCFLFQTPNAATSKASQAFWQVENIEREVCRAETPRREFRGIRHAGDEAGNSIYTGGGAKAAWFKDSEGNTPALIQDIP